MKRFILTIVVLGMFTLPGYCQDNQPPAGADMPKTAAEIAQTETAAADKAIMPQDVSIYGEIKAVNPDAKSVTIQYYDYDSDEEKTIDIVTDSNTKIDNAATISDIKQGNWADVIYSVSGGKNVAKSIIVEKEEEMPAETPKAESAPADTVPVQQ